MLFKVWLHVIGFEFIKLVDINWAFFREITPCSLELRTKEKACFSGKVVS